MTRRPLRAFILLLILLPVLGSIWLGVRMSRDEQAMLRLQQHELLAGRLALLREDISAFLKEYEKDLLGIILEFTNEPSQVRSIRRKSSHVTGFFMLDKKGALLFPGTIFGPLSSQEEEFLQDTHEIWKEKRLVHARPATEKPEALSKNKSFSALRARRGIWYSYFQNDGQGLFYYMHSKGIGYHGAALSMSRFKADLINSFKADLRFSVAPGEYVQIAEPDGKILFYWGDVPSEGTFPRREMSELPAPLSNWRLTYHVSDTRWSQSRAAKFNIGSGMFLLITVFMMLGVLTYRMQTGAMREAEQRVSFVNQVSHELKTPLTNIRMYAELLEQAIPEDDSDALDKLGIITRESERLSRLILNILSFGKGEAKKLKLHRSRGSVSDIVEEVLAEFRPAFREPGIEIVLEGNARGAVSLDRDALHQILGNLLSNVEKYAKGGSRVLIEISQDNEQTRIVITDEGIGVRFEDRARIFDPFYRGSTKLNEGVSGTGIGLHISRELARLHGGDLVLLESKSGASFELTLHTPLFSGGA